MLHKNIIFNKIVFDFRSKYMKRILVFIIFIIFSFSYADDSMPVIGMDGLMKEIKSHNAKTMVVFWAPWCPYCIREMKIIRDNPQFMSNNNLQIIGLTKIKDSHAASKMVKKSEFKGRFFIAKQEIYDELQKIDAVPLTIVFSNTGKKLDEEYGKQDLEDLALMLED